MKRCYQILLLLGLLSICPNVAFPAGDSLLSHIKQDKGLIHHLIKKIIPAKGKYAVNPPKDTKAGSQNPLEVFGWHPYWLNSLHPSYDINKLTTLSYYGIEVSLDEKTNTILFNKNGWDADVSEIIKKVKQSGCRLEVTLVVQDNKTAKAILDKQKEACIDSLVAIIKSTPELDGLTISFHANEIGNRNRFTEFIRQLYQKTNPLKKEISLAISGKSAEKYYHLKALSPYVSRYIVKGYHYHHEMSKPGPIAPLEQSSSYLQGSLKHSISLYEKEGIDKSKMILAFPYYAAIWEIDDKKEKRRFQEYLHYKDVIAMIKKHSLKINYDSITHSSSVYFSNNGKNYVCYFESEKSLQHKYSWVAQQGLIGIGIWALGYDHGQEELWNLLATDIAVVRKDSSSGKNKKTQPDSTPDTTQQKDQNSSSNSIAKSDKIKPITPPANGEKENASAKKEGEQGQNVIDEASIVQDLTNLIKHPAVMSVAITLAICYLIIGCVSSLFDDEVRAQLEITNMLHYLVINLGIIVCFLLLHEGLKYAIIELDYLITITATEVTKYLILIWLFIFLIINVLSYKLLVQNLGGQRLP